MTPEARKALEGSITAWKKRAAGEYKYPRTDYCPLCKLFHEGENSDIEAGYGCLECPIMGATGKSGCNDTPLDNYDDDERAAEVAGRMVEFMEGLL